MSYSEPKTHDLKTWPFAFEKLLTGEKTFEVREDDRGYMVGDTLLLREYDPESETYTGREYRRQVSYILKSSHASFLEAALRRGFCVMGLAPAWNLASEVLPEMIDGEPWSAYVLVADERGALADPHCYSYTLKKWFERNSSRTNNTITRWLPMPAAPQL